MGKIEEYMIKFSREPAVYRAGEFVSGTVELNVKERLKIKSITASIKGSAKCEWHEVVDVNGQENYSDQENYMDKHFTLISKHDDSHNNQPEHEHSDHLDKGHHSWPFRVQIPQRAPTSFESDVGRVRYSVRSTIHSPWSIDKHADASFTVLHELDLNEHRELTKPTTASETQCMGYGPFKHHDHPIRGTLRLKKSAYVPGEFIEFETELENLTHHCVRETQVTLRQLVVIHAGKKHHSMAPHDVCHMIYSNTDPSKNKSCHNNQHHFFHHHHDEHLIDREQTKTNWRGQMRVPAVCPTFVEGLCRQITVKYELQLSINVSRLHSTKHVHLPVVIGSVPYRDSYDSFFCTRQLPSSPSLLRSSSSNSSSSSSPSSTETTDGGSEANPVSSDPSVFPTNLQILPPSRQESTEEEQSPPPQESSEKLKIDCVYLSSPSLLSPEEYDFVPLYPFYSPEQKKLQ